MDTQLLQYRLKSARRKKRLQKEDRDKQLLKLDREHSALRANPERVTIKQLDEPYQKGWKRLYVLRPEVARSDEAAFYQHILDYINDVQYHYDASFKKRKHRKDLDNRGLPELKTIDAYYWDLNKPDFTDAQRACFNKVEYWDAVRYKTAYRYQFAKPHLFEIKVLPHIVTTIREVDVLMEQRMSFITDRIYKGKWQYRLIKLKDSGYSYW
ncbi:MAG: hypothetical protein EOO68_29120, partial [Moraxellaceae bacterium]